MWRGFLMKCLCSLVTAHHADASTTFWICCCASRHMHLKAQVHVAQVRCEASNAYYVYRQLGKRSVFLSEVWHTMFMYMCNKQASSVARRLLRIRSLLICLSPSLNTTARVSGQPVIVCRGV